LNLRLSMSTVHTRERQYNGSRNIDKNSTTAHGGFALKVRNVLGPLSTGSGSDAQTIGVKNR